MSSKRLKFKVRRLGTTSVGQLSSLDRYRREEEGHLGTYPRITHASYTPGKAQIQYWLWSISGPSWFIETTEDEVGLAFAIAEYDFRQASDIIGPYLIPQDEMAVCTACGQLAELRMTTAVVGRRTPYCGSCLAQVTAHIADYKQLSDALYYILAWGRIPRPETESDYAKLARGIMGVDLRSRQRLMLDAHRAIEQQPRTVEELSGILDIGVAETYRIVAHLDRRWGCLREIKGKRLALKEGQHGKAQAEV